MTLHGAGQVIALLPDGRMTWIHLRPAPLAASEVNRLARSIAFADARQAAATRATSRSIERLARTGAASTRQLVNARLRGEKKWQGRIAAGDAKLDRAITAASANGRSADRKEAMRFQRAVQSLRHRDLWNSLVLVSSAPLFAAYGQEGTPVAVPNVVLAISLGVWLAGDELSDYLTGEDSHRIRGGILRDVDVWSYVAPFANMLTAWWLLRDEQHPRFISGIVTFREDTPAQPENVRFDLDVESSDGSSSSYLYTWLVDVAANEVATNHVEEFRSYAGVVALATIGGATWSPKAEPVFGSLTASVTNGILAIRVDVSGPAPPVDSILASLEVAWVVDTRGSSQRYRTRDEP